MLEARGSDTRSQLMASLLAGAWRQRVTASECSLEELELMTPLVMETGAGALAWRRVRDSELEAAPAALQLHDAYRLYKLRAIVYEREIAKIFRLLRSQAIEPVLVKGWAIARHYAEPEARPCGDIDLCVSKEQFAEARAILENCEGSPHTFDLHRGFRHLDDRSFEELMTRSELVELEGEKIRVLGVEDHLRVLCYHFLREGGWRALWLCDISVALESRPASFDWDLCLSGNRREDDWVACSIGLAHQLLGADVSETPVAVKAAKLPAWLLPSILREWEVRSMSQRHRTPMSSAMSQPLRTLKGLHHHWPTPVEATVSLGGAFNELPRLPFQVGNFLARAATLLARLPRALRNEH